MNENAPKSPQELEAHLAELVRANAMLTEANRRKDEFLATLAHELRNPLTALGAAVELIGLKDTDQASRERLIGILARQVQHLSRLLNDLLVLAPSMEGHPVTKDVVPRPRRLLLVDDNVDTAEALASLLGHLGQNVLVAHDGSSALEAAATFQPEIVFLDIGLPGLNGYEVALRLRQQSGLEKTLLVAMTGQEAPSRSIEARFNRYLIKPVRLKTLEKLLSELG
jgi:CheY-like chemotaxis protein